MRIVVRAGPNVPDQWKDKRGSDGVSQDARAPSKSVPEGGATSEAVNYSVIRGYRDARSRRFADGERVPAFDGLRRQAEKRLRVLEAAASRRDLAQLPGNRLEALRGDREGKYSSASTNTMAHLL